MSIFRESEKWLSCQDRRGKTNIIQILSKEYYSKTWSLWLPVIIHRQLRLSYSSLRARSFLPSQWIMYCTIRLLQKNKINRMNIYIFLTIYIIKSSYFDTATTAESHLRGWEHLRLGVLAIRVVPVAVSHQKCWEHGSCPGQGRKLGSSAIPIKCQILPSSSCKVTSFSVNVRRLETLVLISAKGQGLPQPLSEMFLTVHLSCCLEDMISLVSSITL